MPIPAGHTSHAHFASTPADGIHNRGGISAQIIRGKQFIF
jgi:hypothetical protein